MSLQITVLPRQLQISALPEETLLEAALRQGVLLPHGCKNGACGACKCRLNQGEISYGNAMPHALSDEEKAKGFLLTCTAKAKTDLIIDCPQVAASTALPIKTLRCRVEKMERLAEDIMAVFLRIPATEKLDFYPGQYIDILTKEGKRKSFSLASAPVAGELLQLHIRLIPEGQFTGHVFNAMRVKDMLQINGPLGGFYLRDVPEKPAILLCGGTGFAPVKAMIEAAILSKNPRLIYLYWGARNQAGLYLHGLATDWAKNQSFLRYVPVLSELLEGEWTGRVGFVHRAVMADFPDLSGYQVYACGAKTMIDAAKNDLCGKNKLSENDFFADAFTA